MCELTTLKRTKILDLTDNGLPPDNVYQALPANVKQAFDDFQIEFYNKQMNEMADATAQNIVANKPNYTLTAHNVKQDLNARQDWKTKKFVGCLALEDHRKKFIYLVIRKAKKKDAVTKLFAEIQNGGVIISKEEIDKYLKAEELKQKGVTDETKMTKIDCWKALPEIAKTYGTENGLNPGDCTIEHVKAGLKKKVQDILMVEDNRNVDDLNPDQIQERQNRMAMLGVQGRFILAHKTEFKTSLNL